MLQHVGQGNLIITNIPKEALENLPEALSGAICTEKRVEQLDDVDLARVALLDQCAGQEMVPEDQSKFDYVLCGGILGCDEFEGPLV
jgi:ribosome biogenesis SPOUT family RNA methylase Rps3